MTHLCPNLRPSASSADNPVPNPVSCLPTSTSIRVPRHPLRTIQFPTRFLVCPRPPQSASLGMICGRHVPSPFSYLPMFTRSASLGIVCGQSSSQPPFPACPCSPQSASLKPRPSADNPVPSPISCLPMFTQSASLGVLCGQSSSQSHFLSAHFHLNLRPSASSADNPVPNPVSCLPTSTSNRDPRPHLRTVQFPAPFLVCPCPPQSAPSASSAAPPEKISEGTKPSRAPEFTTDHRQLTTDQICKFAPESQGRAHTTAITVEGTPPSHLTTEN